MEKISRIICSVIIIFLYSCTKEAIIETRTSGTASALNSTTFEKNFGGSQQDIGVAAAKSNDGGYVIAGRTQSNDGDISGNHGSYDGYLIKIDKNGNKLWQKGYGGSKSDEITGITATKDGGYIFTGLSDSNDGDLTGQSLNRLTFWIVKVDSGGIIEWSKVIMNSLLSHRMRQANSIIQTRSGDYILAGRMFNINNYEGWVCKLSSLGNVIWERIRGGVDENDSFQQVVEDRNCDLWLVGTLGQPSFSNPACKGDVWLFKIGKDGNGEWQKKYGGSLLDEGNSLAIDHNNAIILAGTTYSNEGDVAGFHGGRYDAWVIKVDIDGKKIWQKSVGGTGDELFSSVIAIKNGGYLLAGQTNSQDGDVKNGTNFQSGDGWLVLLSDSGDIQDEKTYGSGGGDAFNFVIQGVGKNYTAGGTIDLSEGNFNSWLISVSSQ